MSKQPYKVGRGKPPIDTKFKKWHTIRATDEQVKAWMDKRTNRRKLADLLLEFWHLTKSQIEQHAKRTDLTINEINVIRYVTSGSRSDKMLVDLMNREISYAPSKQELTWADWKNLVISLDDIIK